MPRSSRHSRMVGLLGVGLAVVVSVPAEAADLEPAAAPIPAIPAVTDADAPVYFFTGYLWASGLSGRTATLPPLPPADIDLSFGDVLKDLDGGIMAAGEMRVGRWSFLADAMFTQVSPNVTLSGPYGAELELRSRSLTLQGDVLYRLYDGEAVDIDAGAGLRYWYLDNKLSVDGGPFPDGVQHSDSQGWVDPVVAGRLSAKLGGPWGITLFGDIGGFDVGSQLTWQALGTVNYQWSENLSLRAGYRALSVDYEDGKFLYDVLMQGPVIGATYRF